MLETYQARELFPEEALDSLSAIDRVPASQFDARLYKTLQSLEAYAAKTEDADATRRSFVEASAPIFSIGDVQGRARAKPMGYAGDFLLIDWMYEKRLAPSGKALLWDQFYHRQEAARAVRSRKRFFTGLVLERARKTPRPISVLDVACGSCRDVAEAISLARQSGTPVPSFRCIDLEAAALEHGRRLLPDDSRDSVEFLRANVLTASLDGAFDLAWCAGLFDYLSDRLAARLLRRMWVSLGPGGSLVVGNFHPDNPTRLYMEWCVDWRLIHRSERALLRLARAAGINEGSARVVRDPGGAVAYLVADR